LRLDAEAAKRHLKEGYTRRRVSIPEYISNDFYFKEGGKIKALKAFLNHQKGMHAIL
jgi:hypothetical protein